MNLVSIIVTWRTICVDVQVFQHIIRDSLNKISSVQLKCEEGEAAPCHDFVIKLAKVSISKVL